MGLSGPSDLIVLSLRSSSESIVLPKISYVPHSRDLSTIYLLLNFDMFYPCCFQEGIPFLGPSNQPYRTDLRRYSRAQVSMVTSELGNHRLKQLVGRGYRYQVK